MTKTHPNQSRGILISLTILKNTCLFAAFPYIRVPQTATKIWSKDSFFKSAPLIPTASTNAFHSINLFLFLTYTSLECLVQKCCSCILPWINNEFLKGSWIKALLLWNGLRFREKNITAVMKWWSCDNLCHKIIIFSPAFQGILKTHQFRVCWLNYHRPCEKKNYHWHPRPSCSKND